MTAFDFRKFAVMPFSLRRIESSYTQRAISSSFDKCNTRDRVNRDFHEGLLRVSERLFR